MFECANTFDASDEELHSEFLVRYPKDNTTFQELTNFYGHHGSLPIIAEKNIIALFRKCMIYDNAVEDIQPVQISSPTTKAVIQERRIEQMETEECEFLEDLYLQKNS